MTRGVVHGPVAGEIDALIAAVRTSVGPHTYYVALSALGDVLAEIISRVALDRDGGVEGARAFGLDLEESVRAHFATYRRRPGVFARSVQ